MDFLALLSKEAVMKVFQVEIPEKQTRPLRGRAFVTIRVEDGVGYFQEYELPAPDDGCLEFEVSEDAEPAEDVRVSGQMRFTVLLTMCSSSGNRRKEVTLRPEPAMVST